MARWQAPPSGKRSFVSKHRSSKRSFSHPKKAPTKKTGLPVKQQIRNVNRLLARVGVGGGLFFLLYKKLVDSIVLLVPLAQPGLPDEIKRKQEIKLAALEKDLAAHELKMLARKYKKRYRRVRHVESTKLQRRVAQLRRDLRAASTEEERAALLEKLGATQLDLQYVEHFAPTEKYISILVDPEDPEQLEHVRAERPRLRALAARIAAEAAVLTEADEGRGVATALGESLPPSNAQVASESDDEFFLNDEGVGGLATGGDNGRPVRSGDDQAHPVSKDEDTKPAITHTRATLQKTTGPRPTQRQAAKRREPNAPTKQKEAASNSRPWRKQKESEERTRSPRPARTLSTAIKASATPNKQESGARSSDFKRSAPPGHQMSRPEPASQPQRTRAEGGRKRRKKRNDD